jgi:site-specific recombinase XerD
VTLAQVWHEWRAGRIGAGAATGPMLSEAVRQFLAAKTAARLARGTVKKLAGVLAWLIARLPDCRVSAVSHVDVVGLLESKGPDSWNTIAATLAGFFAWCIRHGCRTDNPLDRIDRKRDVQRVPGIFTLEDVKQCLAWLIDHRPKALAWFILTTFCGLRPEEAQRTKWEAVR